MNPGTQWRQQIHDAAARGVEVLAELESALDATDAVGFVDKLRAAMFHVREGKSSLEFVRDMTRPPAVPMPREDAETDARCEKCGEK